MRVIITISALVLCGCAAPQPAAQKPATLEHGEASKQTESDSPSDTSAHYRANLLINDSGAAIMRGEYSKAQALAIKATQTDPEFPEAWYCYGSASVHLGQTERGQEAYEHMLSLYKTRHRQHPSDGRPVLSEISSLILLGRSAEAEALLEQARIDYPGDKQFTNADRFTQLQHDLADSAVEARQ